MDFKSFSQTLDKMTHDERVHATRSLPRADLAVLFAQAEGARHLEPGSFWHGDTTHHIGTNNMPMARAFEKPIFRVQGQLAGRNVQPWAWLTGPGYFTVHRDQDCAGQVIFNYINVPPGAPSNARGMSYFVFRGLTDVMRGVSEHVTVGRAFRHGKPLPNYFVLVRRD